MCSEGFRKSLIAIDALKQIIKHSCSFSRIGLIFRSNLLFALSICTAKVSILGHFSSLSLVILFKAVEDAISVKDGIL